MNNRPDADKTGEAADFIRQAGEDRPGAVKELWVYLRQNRKWWLTPIIVILILIGVLIILQATAVAPLIYTLF